MSSPSMPFDSSSAHPSEGSFDGSASSSTPKSSYVRRNESVSYTLLRTDPLTQVATVATILLLFTNRRFRRSYGKTDAELKCSKCGMTALALVAV